MERAKRDAWTAALRSGEYVQTNGQLKSINEHDEAEFCCLGVYLDVAGDGQWDQQTWIDNADAPEIENDYMGVSLDTEMVERDGDWDWLLRDKYGLTEDEETKLIHMNDGFPDKGIDKHTFAQIADWIEENL